MNRGSPINSLKLWGLVSIVMIFNACAMHRAKIDDDVILRTKPMDVQAPIFGRNGTTLEGITISDLPLFGHDMGYFFRNLRLSWYPFSSHRITFRLLAEKSPLWQVRCISELDANLQPATWLTSVFHPLNESQSAMTLALYADGDRPFDGSLVVNDEIYSFVGTNLNELDFYLDGTTGLTIYRQNSNDMIGFVDLASSSYGLPRGMRLIPNLDEQTRTNIVPSLLASVLVHDLRLRYFDGPDKGVFRYRISGGKIPCPSLPEEWTGPHVEHARLLLNMNRYGEVVAIKRFLLTEEEQELRQK